MQLEDCPECFIFFVSLVFQKKKKKKKKKKKEKDEQDATGTSGDEEKKEGEGEVGGKVGVGGAREITPASQSELTS